MIALAFSLGFTQHHFCSILRFTQISHICFGRKPHRAWKNLAGWLLWTRPVKGRKWILTVLVCSLPGTSWDHREASIGRTDVRVDRRNVHIIPAKFHLSSPIFYCLFSQPLARKEVFAFNFYSKSLSLCFISSQISFWYKGAWSGDLRPKVLFNFLFHQA